MSNNKIFNKLRISLFIIILSLLLSSITFADDMITTDLVSSWYLNDTLYNETDSILDSWGINHGTGYGKTFYHGTNNGATYNTTNPVNDSFEKFGGYYDFDGDNAKIERTDFYYLNNSMSMTVWAKQNVYEANAGLVGQYVSSIPQRSWGLITQSVDELRVVYSDNGLNPYSVTTSNNCGFTNNEWTNFEVIFNGTNWIFYKNGELCEVEVSAVSNLYDASSYFDIGVYKPTTTLFNGSIDEVKIWNRALSQEEIQEEMSSNAVANAEGIVAYYDFNDDSGTTVYDTNHLSTGARQLTTDLDNPVFSWDKAISFDGVDDYVELNNSFNYDTSDNFTISLFIKSNVDETAYFLGNNVAGVNWIQLNSGNKLYVEFTTNGDYCIGDDIIYKDNYWHNYIIAVNGTNCKFYEDGSELIMSDAIRSSALDISRIGNRGDTSSAFNGSIADVRIYDRALTEAEISTIYKGTNESAFTSYTPTNLTLEPLEGEAITFEVETSWANTIKWYLDGVFQKIGSVWTWFVGVNDAELDPNKEVIAFAEDGTNSETIKWDVTVQNNFPITPYNVSPYTGLFDSEIPIKCYIDDDNFWFKNSTYKFWVYYNDSDSTEWRQVADKINVPVFDFYVLDLPEQSGVKVKCQSYDGFTYSDNSTESGNITISHKKSKLELYDVSMNSKVRVNENNFYRVYTKYEDSFDDYKIKNIYADCNDDGIWDDVTYYNETDVDEDSLLFSCKYPEEGVYYLNIGVIIEKTNQTKEWNIPFCKSLPFNQYLCDYNKAYNVEVYNKWR